MDIGKKILLDIKNKINFNVYMKTKTPIESGDNFLYKLVAYKNAKKSKFIFIYYF
jgi:hypothetical protein